MQLHQSSLVASQNRSGDRARARFDQRLLPFGTGRLCCALHGSGPRGLDVARKGQAARRPATGALTPEDWEREQKRELLARYEERWNGDGWCDRAFTAGRATSTFDDAAGLRPIRSLIGTE